MPDIRVAEAISMFQELDLLEAHLEESSHWADKVYIIESPITFSGQEKLMYFCENRERFSRFNVEYLVTPPEVFTPIPFSYPEEESGHWYRERRKNRNKNRQHHWDTIREGMDYVYFNDVDEFVSADHWHHVLSMLESKELHYVSIKARKFNFFVNCRGSEQEQWRITRTDLPSFEMMKGKPRASTPCEVGWHFTNCFNDLEGHRLKMLGICCHVGVAPSDIPTVAEIEDRLGRNVEPFVNKDLLSGIAEIMPKDDLSWAPSFMRKNIELFPWFNKKGVSKRMLTGLEKPGWRLP